MRDALRRVKELIMTFGRPVPTVVQTVAASWLASLVRNTPTSVPTKIVFAMSGSTSKVFTGALGRAVPPLPLISCQVPPPSVVRKTCPLLSTQSAQPEKPE